MIKSREGYIRFKDYKTYYITYGNLSKNTPVIALHGGPGFPHFYLQNLSELVNLGFPVVLYDQLGCGLSDRPDNRGLWTIDTFIDELETVRNELSLNEIFLMGHSWGGTLASEYMLRDPKGVLKLIFYSPLLDSKLWAAETRKLVEKLPKWAAEQMIINEDNGTTDSYEYSQAYQEFRNRHICRIVPNPIDYVKSNDMAGSQVYNTMWGPSETVSSGNLKDWSVMDRLKSITAPTLLISGKYDEATPRQMDLAYRNLHNSARITMNESSHLSNLEEPEKFRSHIVEFLKT